MKTTFTAISLLAVAGVLPVLACSSSSSSPGSTEDSTPTGPLPQGPTTFTMDGDVAGGSEAFKCQYVAMPPGNGFIVGGQNEFTPGSHHVVMYSTDLSSIPSDHAGIEDCYEGAGSMMTHIRGVVYAATNAKAGLDMPAGVGIPYKSGAVMLFQNHFLDAGAQSMRTKSQVYLKTATGGVTQNADVLFYYDPYIDVPAGARAKASMRCPIPKDITLVAFGSHYHARGVGFQAYVDPPNAAPATKPFYTSTNWASPTIVTNQSLAVRAGSRIRYFCDYDNTTGSKEYVQGESATNDEMCMFIALYYPAMTLADDYCESGDMVGTGTTSCVDTLNCVGACPPAGDTSEENGYSPCLQKCVADSCPGAAGPLGTVKTCVDQKCGAVCGAADGGVSDMCRTCVTSNCFAEYVACAKAPCEAQ